MSKWVSRYSLWAAREVREANYVTSDVRLGLEGRDAGVGAITDLTELIDGRYWWSGHSSRT